jgi:hypothetical protein
MCELERLQTRIVLNFTFIEVQKIKDLIICRRTSVKPAATSIFLAQMKSDRTVLSSISRRVLSIRHYRAQSNGSRLRLCISSESQRKSLEYKIRRLRSGQVQQTTSQTNHGTNPTVKGEAGYQRITVKSKRSDSCTKSLSIIICH